MCLCVNMFILFNNNINNNVLLSNVQLVFDYSHVPCEMLSTRSLSTCTSGTSPNVPVVFVIEYKDSNVEYLDRL